MSSIREFPQTPLSSDRKLHTGQCDRLAIDRRVLHPHAVGTFAITIGAVQAQVHHECAAWTISQALALDEVFKQCHSRRHEL